MPWRASDVLNMIGLTCIFLLVIFGLFTHNFLATLASLAAIAARYYSKLNPIVRMASQIIFLAAASTGSVLSSLLSSIAAITMIYEYSRSGDKKTATRLGIIAFSTTPFYAISLYSLVYGLALYLSLLLRFVYSYTALSKASAALAKKALEVVHGEEISIEIFVKSPLPLYWSILVNEAKVVTDKYLKEGTIQIPVTNAFVGLNTLAVRVYSEDPQGFGKRLILYDTVAIRVRPRHTVVLKKARRVLLKHATLLEPAEVYRAKPVAISAGGMPVSSIEKAPPIPAVGFAGAGGKGAGTDRTIGGRVGKSAPESFETMGAEGHFKIINLETEGAGLGGGGETGWGVQGAETGGRGLPSPGSLEMEEKAAKKTRPEHPLLVWVPYSTIYGAVSEAIRTLSSYGEYSGVREYQPGDHLKLIHWKKTLSLGRLVVKEYTTTPQRGGGTGSIQLVVADWTATNSADLDNLIYFTLLAILKSPPTSWHLVIVLTPAGEMYLFKGKAIDVLDALYKLIVAKVSSLGTNYRIFREISDYKEYIQAPLEKSRLLVEYYEEAARWIHQTIREHGEGAVDSIMIIHASPTSLKYAVVSDYLKKSGYYTTVINASKIY